MQIAVGTLNPVKIAAVRDILNRIYGKIALISLGVESGVPNQPIGLNQTLNGAINRAKEALKKTNADLGIGIEAGLVRIPFTITGFFDYQFCAIIDRQQWITLGSGSGFEYPPIVIEGVVKKNLEIDEAMENITGIKDMGERQGAVGHLTHGILLRKELTEQSILMAMIPRINVELYRS
ncbi:MAG: inosine/xanthosine triphosphatase [Candidatus Hodarchaeota archaeon]